MLHIFWIFFENSLLLTLIRIEAFSLAVFFFHVFFAISLRIACLTLLVDSLFYGSLIFLFVTDLDCVHLNKVGFSSHNAPVLLAGFLVSTGCVRHLLQVWKAEVKQTPQPVQQTHVVVWRWFTDVAALVAWYTTDPLYPLRLFLKFLVRVCTSPQGIPCSAFSAS